MVKVQDVLLNRVLPAYFPNPEPPAQGRRGQGRARAPRLVSKPGTTGTGPEGGWGRLPTETLKLFLRRFLATRDGLPQPRATQPRTKIAQRLPRMPRLLEMSQDRCERRDQLRRGDKIGIDEVQPVAERPAT